MPPTKPNSVTVRSNSSAAAAGSGVGRAAKPAKRSGLAWITACNRSFAGPASITAVSGSNFWVDGAPCDRIWKSTPA